MGGGANKNKNKHKNADTYFSWKIYDNKKHQKHIDKLTKKTNTQKQKLV